jgi:hypothetical protein
VNKDSTFVPGVYRHYKGGLYTAIMLVKHHESRCAMVLYTSHTFGTTNVRPLCGYLGDEDAWNDWVDSSTGKAITKPDRSNPNHVPRFALTASA